MKVETALPIGGLDQVAAAAALGHRIEAHGSRAFDLHALLGALAVLLAALAAVAGFVLLP